MKFASKRLRADKEVAIEAIKQNKKCYEFLEESMKQDEEVKALLQN